MCIRDRYNGTCNQDAHDNQCPPYEVAVVPFLFLLGITDDTFHFFRRGIGQQMCIRDSINGVGYEVILKTFSDPTMLELCTPIIYGSPKDVYKRQIDICSVIFFNWRTFPGHG